MSSSSSSEVRSAPRAKGIPLLGSLPGMLRGHYRFLEQVFDAQGPIFQLDLGPLKALVIADAEVAEEIYVGKTHNYDKGGEFWESAREIIGGGLGTQEGESWRRHRKLMQPSFRSAAIESYRPMIDETIGGAIDRLEADTPVDAGLWCDDLLSMLTVRILLGAEATIEQARAVRESMGLLQHMVMPEMVWRKLPKWLPRPGRHALTKARRSADDALADIIADKRTRGVGDDLLGSLIHAADEHGTLSDEELRDEAFFIYLAGYETTGISLAWTLLSLAQNPEVLSELQRRLDEPEGDRSYLRACIQEGLRLYPPGALVPRRAVDDDVLGGYAVRAGTLVLVCPWLIHRDPRWWPRPQAFDPSRFMGDAPKSGRPRVAWSPFGAGQRVCVGKGLALLELERTLELLLTRLSPVMADDGPPPTAKLSTTIKPSKPIMLSFGRRAK